MFATKEQVRSYLGGRFKSKEPPPKPADIRRVLGSIMMENQGRNNWIK